MEQTKLMKKRSCNDCRYKENPTHAAPCKHCFYLGSKPAWKPEREPKNEKKEIWQR